jgi:DNA repair protein RadD
MLELRPYQREAVDALYEYWGNGGGNGLIVLPTGCHAAGTRILMHDGTTKPVDLVAANDNVMGPDSRPRRVLRTITGREPMYRITPKRGGEPFVVNENHILSLKTTNEGKKYEVRPGCSQRGGDIENISVKDYLGKAKYWKHLRKLWRTGVEFDVPANDNLPVPAYVVGAMLGDGSLTRSASLTNMDPEVLSEVCDYAASVGVGMRITQKPGNRAYGVFFPDAEANRSTRNRFVAALESAGVWGMVCDQKAIPHVYKTGSRKTRLEILAGLLDTDGHLSKRNHFDFISKSEALSRDVVFVARSVGLSAQLTECQKYCQTGGGGTYWRVSISGDTDMIPNRVERQRSQPRQQKKNPLVTGFTIEHVGEGEFYGFELDGDHLYLTDDFTVHHNSGKALVIAKIIEELLRDYPDMRILNVTHSASLVEQNFKEFIGLLPFAPAGIYSAGLNRRDARAQVLFCGIQSIWNKVDHLGPIDLVLVDEAHAISRNANTQYGKFFRDVRKAHPDSRTAGLTATDYRMDSGRLTDDLDSDGEVDDDGNPVRFKLFDDVVYEAMIGDLIEQGFLTRLTSSKTTAKIDLKGVGSRGGEYIPGQLSAAAERIIEDAVAEDMAMSVGRRAGLFFSTSKENARHIADCIRRHGRTCAVLTSDNAHQTKEIFEGFKAGKYWAISSVSMITTGTNFPFVDFISLILSTKSAGKLVQILGRGTRNFPGKTECLVSDHGKNLAYHGPIDQIRPKAPGSGDGEAPRKVCPPDVADKNGSFGCGELIHASAKECHCCGYVFPPSENVSITATAADAPVLSTEAAAWRPVSSRNFYLHQKTGKPDGIKVAYLCGVTGINDWLGPAHTGYFKTKTNKWWLTHGGQRPFPTTAMEFLDRQRELLPTAEIKVAPNQTNPRYWDVKDTRPAAHNDNATPATNDNTPEPDWMKELDDAIPF